MYLIWKVQRKFVQPNKFLQLCQFLNIGRAKAVEAEIAVGIEK